MTTILGVNAFHADASACLLRDGDLIAAAEEERFKRTKHWAGLPVEAVRYCLREAGISFKDLSTIAISSNPRVNLLRKGLYALTRRPGAALVRDRLNSRVRRRAIPELLADALNDREFHGELRFVEHHLAHLASSYFTSPFEKALALSIDGFGDFASTAWGLGEGERLEIDERIYFPHSLGIYYEAITRFLGFKVYGDEYKVMGLAAYGSTRYEKEMNELVRLEADGCFKLNLKYFKHQKGDEVTSWDDCAPVTGDSYSCALYELFGGPRSPEAPIEQKHMDIACSAQNMYEQALFHVVRHIHASHEIDNLVLSGGCALNSAANGKLSLTTPIKKVFVQAAAGDAGGALGAALYCWHAHSHGKRRFDMQHAYWGPSYSDEEVERELHNHRGELEGQDCRWWQMDSTELLDYTASAISEGKVIGWFQGRMEWGPRALGNRSILCDPRRGDMKDILNRKIKCRESFRPFAPSILREAVSDWFEADDDVPFMTKVLNIRPERRKAVPAVTHVDGSGRLQTVERHQNPMFYGLIESFNELTGVPMLLNTSFNQSEPIVCTVAEAIDCFIRTRMDVLVLGRHVLAREEAMMRGNSERLATVGL